MTLSEKLKVLRQESRLTRKAVAEQTGISIATYSAYEDGKRLPKRNPENYDKLAAVFGCSAEYLKDDSAVAETPSKSNPTKTPGKRTGRKKKEPAAAPIRMELQFGDKTIDMYSLAAKARELDGAISDLYIKPEDNAVYYVAGENSGSFELFIMAPLSRPRAKFFA